MKEFKKIKTKNIFFSSFFPAVQGQITQNHESIVVTKGESMDLICSAAETTPKACSFLDPSGRVMVILDGVP